MAHLAVEPSLGHPVREVGDAKREEITRTRLLGNLGNAP